MSVERCNNFPGKWEDPWRNEQSYQENKRLLNEAIDAGVLRLRSGAGEA